jgi:D-arabinose 1-dehydrogenase-like Zn-dependent alcohol dehydrogenase
VVKNRPPENSFCSIRWRYKELEVWAIWEFNLRPRRDTAWCRSGGEARTRRLAKKLGAAEYIDSMATKPADGLQKLGGARVILATAPNAKAMSQLVGGLGVGGRLLVVGAPFEPLEISALQLIGPRRGIQGWPSGSAMDSEDTLRFCAQSGVRPMIERYPLTKVKEWC